MIVSRKLTSTCRNRQDQHVPADKHTYEITRFKSTVYIYIYSVYIYSAFDMYRSMILISSPFCFQDVRQHEAMRTLPGGDSVIRIGDACARARLPRALLLVRSVRGALDEGRPVWHAGQRRALPAAL